MGLGPAAIKLNLELRERGFYKNIESAIEMGSQELILTQADFEALVCAANVPNYKKENFINLANWPGSPRCCSKPFYEMLGVKKYSCIDLDREHGAIPLDLNFPLEDLSLYGQYDLVTDYGNNEHVFNTVEAYRSMHRLCKQQGFIIIAQALYGGNGYYAYNPSFFEGIAAANNYKIIFSSYVPVFHPRTKAASANEFHLPPSEELIEALDWTKVEAVGIYYVMQKQSAADFCYPYQGEYQSRVKGHYGYRLQFLPTPPSRTYVPIYSLETISARSLLQVLWRKAIKRFKAV